MSDDSFGHDVLLSCRPVLVNFCAEWCEESRFISETVETLSREFAGITSVVNLDVDQNPVATGQNCIDIIPTLILFNQGKEAQRIKGVSRIDIVSGLVLQLLRQMLTSHDRFIAPRDLTKSPYEILNVSIGANRNEIHSAYKEMAKLYHPDKVASLAPEFKELADIRMKEINRAYRSLLD